MEIVIGAGAVLWVIWSAVDGWRAAKRKALHWEKLNGVVADMERLTHSLQDRDRGC